MAFAHFTDGKDCAGRFAFRRFAETHRVPEPAGCFERMRERETALFDSSERAAKTVGRLRDAGASELVLWASFGGLDPERVEET